MSITIAFIFFFNITGLSGLAIATDLQPDPLEVQLNQKLQEIRISLNAIKAGDTNLTNLQQQYQELSQLNAAFSVELEKIQTEMSQLVNQGTVTPEFLERSKIFADQYANKLTSILEGINNVLISNGEVTELLEELTPKVTNNILGSKLTTRLVKLPKKNHTIRSRGVPSLPTESDVAESVDVQITPDISMLEIQ